jgi:pyruvate dehydrogenase E2 component (dihydrolipoamide acetyltransferase)
MSNFKCAMSNRMELGAQTMATEVVMPQMGESIAEGTIVRWIKHVGDAVDRDEPLFEISTDKVDAEIPSPAAGVLAEVRAKEGDTVLVNSVVAVISEGEAAVSGADGSEARAAQPSQEPVPSTKESARPAAPPPPAQIPSPPPSVSQASPAADRKPAGPRPVEEAIRQRSSPLVRRIAKERNIDISQIHGTGIAGRVTKDDILAYADSAAQSPHPKRTEPASAVFAPAPEQGGLEPGLRDEIVPMTIMRRRIAEHMVASRRTSAHVHSVFEVNFSRVAQARERSKEEFERAGTRLTYLAFIIKAAVGALTAMPIVNASVDGENIVYHKDVNIGVAVALDWGLIVPVIKRANELNLLGISRAVADLADRARRKQLKPEEVAAGTFTITNPGSFGALFGMPIINQPQVAILGVGAIEKRPVVIDDAIAIRPTAHLTLGYDHRLIDGAVADQFMARVKQALESWDIADT